MTDELLTQNEIETLDALAELTGRFSRVLGHGPTRSEDFREVVLHVRALQNMVMSQAAARAYPAKFRLLGESIHTDMKVHIEPRLVRCEYVGDFGGQEQRQCVLPRGHKMKQHLWDPRHTWEAPDGVRE